MLYDEEFDGENPHDQPGFWYGREVIMSDWLSPETEALLESVLVEVEAES